MKAMKKFDLISVISLCLFREPDLVLTMVIPCLLYIKSKLAIVVSWR